MDIGTAKGFSAVVMAQVLAKFGADIPVITVDVIDPDRRTARNTVAEVDGLKTLHETMAPFVPNGIRIKCCGGGSRDVLVTVRSVPYRIPFAFVDGKHNFHAVASEADMIASLQKAGDVTIFDDCQLPEVARAVRQAAIRLYDVVYVHSGPRTYAIGRRK